ncbi:MAG TPA: hypothetical protein VMB79_15910 [Jatrophihabitans sp.]|nr:hypothetical protein [Jatrophihabitans sp.]
MIELDRRFTGLSCYTSNLVGYLAAEFEDAPRRFAESVRLAVRTDLPGELDFLHNQPGLDRLPDGTRLGYAAGSDRAHVLGELQAELRRHGRCLAVVDNSRLPWSPGYGTSASAPHWILLGEQAGDGWHVTDTFGGLLPAGEQEPYQGWLTTAELLAAMGPPARWRPEQRRRNSLVFGYPCPQPEGAELLWLRREADPGSAPAEPSGTWLTTDREVLPFLAQYFVDEGEHAARYLDDLWAAANHRAFRHRMHGNETAELAWSRLPAALRFAVDSARRQRPRWSMVQTTMAHLLELETGLSAGCAAADTASPTENR